MNKAVLFDLDGTLIDTIQDITDAMNKMLVNHGFSPVSADEMKSNLGGSSRDITRLAIGKEISESLLDQCLNEYTDNYISGKSPKTCVFPGMEKVIKQLKNRGYKLFAVSNKPNFEIDAIYERVLAPLGLDAVIGLSEKVSPKPNPEGTLNLLKKFDVAIENAYFVGDGETDVMTALNAKINCIAVLWGNRNKDFLSKYGATVFANTPEELLSLIK